MMKVECNNVNELKVILAKLSNMSESFVKDDYDDTELYILLKNLEDTLIKDKEKILKNKFLYNIAFDHMQNLINMPEDNYLKNIVEHINIYEVYEANEEQISKNTKTNYILEFENNRIGHYTLHFSWNSAKYCDIADIELFRPNRIYKDTRAVKAIVEDKDSYIESYSIDEGYLIIRNDTMNKFAVFTSKDHYHFNYLKPEDTCKDADRI